MLIWEMEREVIPINTDTEGNSRCIKAQYYKMGFTNFMRSLEGRCSDGFIATGVMEIIYEQDQGSRTCMEESAERGCL